MSTADFIASHRRDDVEQLALQADKYPEVDMPYALTQIAGWQTAQHKIPSWAARQGVIYPPHRAMEQCSSEATALYKRRLVSRWLALIPPQKHLSMVDLTGGYGVDCAFLAPLFDDITFIERDANLCNIARQNFAILEIAKVRVVCGDAQTQFSSMKPPIFAYIDPDRRDVKGRHFALEDCSPNVLEMNSQLLEKALFSVVKCSPMLDWRAAVQAVRGVREVHIVAVENECKELLLVLSAQAFAGDCVRLFCANDEDIFSFVMGDEKSFLAPLAPSLSPDFRGFLYEPNAAIMKAGCFDLVAKKYGLEMIERNSHLFISPDEIGDFCGKTFEIVGLSTLNKRDVKMHLRGITHANIVTRNFPLSAAALRRRLHLLDGGDTFIFATTDAARRHILIICQRRN